MATHEFGVLGWVPRPEERYDCYMPELCYPMVQVDDEWIEDLWPDGLDQVPCFWEGLCQPGVGLDYCGISLIPPESLDQALRALGADPRLDPLRALIRGAKAQGRWVLHYGL